ncbi:MAG: Holliday junction branch migration protein RuvA [Acidobacteria bacterium]|nr:Holliday junction branch migration protein RuvA [Acidobacteriota bacterium]
MIAFLRGIITEKKPDHAILDVSGVGYMVHIPVSTFYQLAGEGESQELYIHTHVREDQLALYGFASQQELDMFRALCSVRGFGPRLAVTVLSGMEPEMLIQCLVNGDAVRLSTIPGLGRKTAERLIYELKDKLPRYVEAMTGTAGEGPAAIPAAGFSEDLVSALVNLGYARNVAEKAVAMAVRETPDAGFESLLKRSLKIMITK